MVLACPYHGATGIKVGLVLALPGFHTPNIAAKISISSAQLLFSASR